jgi:predicted membrane protein DUF2238
LSFIRICLDVDDMVCELFLHCKPAPLRFGEISWNQPGLQHLRPYRYVSYRPIANVSLASVLFGSYVLLWSAMAVADRLAQLGARQRDPRGRRRRRFSGHAASSSAVEGLLPPDRRFITLHTIGPLHVRRVPLASSLSPFLGSGHNDYDRIVHFTFGLLLAYPIQEVLARLTNARGLLLYYVPGMTLVGLSGLWEVLESWVADMAAAFYGVLLWLVISAWARYRVARHAVESPSPRF